MHDFDNIIGIAQFQQQDYWLELRGGNDYVIIGNSYAIIDNAYVIDLVLMGLQLSMKYDWMIMGWLWSLMERAVVAVSA